MLRLRILSVALAMAAGTDGQKAAASSFDGRWAVEVRSEDGDCSGLYVMPVEVIGSEIVYVGRGDVAVEGRVDTNGAVRARFFNGSELVDARGELRGGTFGNGSWISPTEGCSGTWIARKR